MIFNWIPTYNVILFFGILLNKVPIDYSIKIYSIGPPILYFF